ncbi:MAG: hypothetical protein ACYSSN_07275 [Planctomycetota bacterium]
MAIDKEDITAIALMVVGRQQLLVPAGATFKNKDHIRRSTLPINVFQVFVHGVIAWPLQCTFAEEHGGIYI